MIQSLVKEMGVITLPLIEGEFSMIPFNLKTLKGLPEKFNPIVQTLLKGIKCNDETAFFTLHGKRLKNGETLRRPGPHTDGCYDKTVLGWGQGGGGWKIGENGPPIHSQEHKDLYINPNGGIILASNFPSCKGYIGNFNGIPHIGGNCNHIKLNKGFLLEKNKVYYGNNHFIHESLPVTQDVHRVMVRITLPKNHKY